VKDQKQHDKMSEKPVVPDLDFVRYADDIQHSTSLKKYIESGKSQQQKRTRRRASKSRTSSMSESDDSRCSSNIDMFTRKKEIQKRLGPDGCEGQPEQRADNGESSGQQELHFVRGQMQNALVRLRELEEQVKTIPQLEVKISILTQQKNQLVESVGIEKERLHEAERDNGKLTARLKDIVVLEEDNGKLMLHIQELESIVEKVNCEVRSIAAQTEYTSIKSNSLHINEHEYDSSGSASSSRASLDVSLGSAASRRRKRRPATRSVAVGGFEYIDNIVCYDRTCLRNVGIGTSTQTRDFGHQANIKSNSEVLRIDKAVGNHIEHVSIACLAKPESRDKRSGKSRAFQCDASTMPNQLRTMNQGTCCSLISPAKSSTPKTSVKSVQSSQISTQTKTSSHSIATGTDVVTQAAVACEANVATASTSTGPDHQLYADQSSHVNWLGENSRSRRTQTNQSSSAMHVEVQTESISEKDFTTTGTDPIITSDASNSSLNGSIGAISSASGPLSLPEQQGNARPGEPREFDPFFNDENEIIYLFRSKSTDPEDTPDSEGEGEMRTLLCKETRDIAIGPDQERDIQEEAIIAIQELIRQHPDDYERILGFSTSPLDEEEESDKSEPDSDPKVNISAADSVSYSKDFGSSQEIPLMTDIEERYELPDVLIEECIALSVDLARTDRPEVPKQLKREWFAVSSKPNSSALVVDDFLSCAAECASKSILAHIINAFDLNGNCALHYAISHSNLDVVSVILRTEQADYNVYNKAGYTPVMLTALVEASGKQDLSPLTRLFKGADLNLQSKKEGQTALMLACGHGRRDMVRLLLMNGCNVNAQDEEGSTALMCAAEHGHVEIVKLILDQQECNASIEDHDGSTAMSIAMDCNHRDIGVMLYAKMNF